MAKAAQAYIAAVIAVGALIGTVAIMQWSPNSVGRLAVFLGLFSGAALLKVRVPGVTGTYSPVFVFILMSSAVLSLSEVVVASTVAAVVQCTINVLWRPTLLQVSFNMANMMISAASAFAVINRQLPGLTEQPLMILMILGASVYYFVNTALVSVVLTLVDTKPLSEMWRHWCLGSLPYYFAGALIAGVTVNSSNQLTLWVVVMASPAVLLATIYYRFWLRTSLVGR